MKVTQREKIMLLSLLLVAVIAAGYYFVFAPTMLRAEALNNEYIDYQDQADQITLDLLRLPQLQADILQYELDYSITAASYYPEIIQEKLMLEVNDLLQHAGLKATSFSYAIQEGLLVTNYQAAQQPEADDQAEDPESDEEPVAESVEQSLDDVKIFSIDLQFTGSSEQLRSFIAQVEKSERMIKLNNLSYQVEYTQSGVLDLPEDEEEPSAPDAEEPEEPEEPDQEAGDQPGDEVNDQPQAPDQPSEQVLAGIRGSFTLNFYAVNKPAGMDAEYFNW